MLIKLKMEWLDFHSVVPNVPFTHMIKTDLNTIANIFALD